MSGDPWDLLEMVGTSPEVQAVWGAVLWVMFDGSSDGIQLVGWTAVHAGCFGG